MGVTETEATEEIMPTTINKEISRMDNNSITTTSRVTVTEATEVRSQQNVKPKNGPTKKANISNTQLKKYSWVRTRLYNDGLFNTSETAHPYIHFNITTSHLLI